MESKESKKAKVIKADTFFGYTKKELEGLNYLALNKIAKLFSLLANSEYSFNFFHTLSKENKIKVLTGSVKERAEIIEKTKKALKESLSGNTTGVKTYFKRIENENKSYDLKVIEALVKKFDLKRNEDGEIENIEKMEAKIDDKKIKVLYMAIIFSVIAAILYSFILVRIYPW